MTRKIKIAYFDTEIIDHEYWDETRVYYKDDTDWQEITEKQFDLLLRYKNLIPRPSGLKVTIIQQPIDQKIEIEKSLNTITKHIEAELKRKEILKTEKQKRDEENAKKRAVKNLEKKKKELAALEKLVKDNEKQN